MALHGYQRMLPKAKRIAQVKIRFFGSSPFHKF